MIKKWTKSVGLIGNTAGLVLGAITFASVPIELSLDYIWDGENQPKAVGLAKIWLKWSQGAGALGTIGAAGVGYYGRARKGDVITPRFMPGLSKGDVEAAPVVRAVDRLKAIAATEPEFQVPDYSVIGETNEQI